jgi:outer membrane protein
MRTLKLMAPVFVVAFATSMTSRAHAEELKVAVVDLYKAISETEDGRKAKQQLEGYFEKKQKKLDSKSEDLKEKMEDLKKKEKVLDQDEYKDEVEALQEEIVTLQGTYAEYQKQVLDKEMKLTEPILEKLEEILKRIGQKEGFTVILRKEAVAWAPNYTDITDKVIQEYNSEPSAFKSKDTKKKKKKATDTKKKPTDTKKSK